MLQTHGIEKRSQRIGPQLVVTGGTRGKSSLSELAAIASRRCSSFCAEAAVLVLVFGILDFFVQHGHISAVWAAGAAAISIGLLSMSIVMEFSARRSPGAHP